MKTAFLTGIREIEIRETAQPDIMNPEDVLLQIDVVGVCGSDVHYYAEGKIGSQLVQYPQTVGHECSGIVMKTGASVKGLKIGDRVAVEPTIACGSCDQCFANRPHTCRNLQFLGCPCQAPGAISEYLVIPSECCFSIPDSMTLTQAALAEPLSIGVYAHRLAKLESGVKVAVLGCGPIGLCTILSIRSSESCIIYATDLLDNRLKVAGKCGADWTGSPEGEDIVEAILKKEPLGLDCVFECAGEQETLDQGVELLKPGGTLVMVGIPESDYVTFNINSLRRKELCLQNVRRENDCLKAAIDLIASGKVNADPLVTHHFNLSEIQQAFDLAAAYGDGVIKAMIHINTNTV